MPTITIRSSAGVDALVQRGLSVAAASAWTTEPNAVNALVGLWLANHLTRAELRGSISFIGDGAESLNPMALLEIEAPLGGARRALDTMLARAWIALDSLIDPNLRRPDQLDVELGGDTGIAPVAGWAAVAVVIVRGAVIVGCVWQARELVTDWLARNAAASQVAKDAEELDRLAREHLQREQTAGKELPLDPITKTKVNAIAERQRYLVQRASAGSKPEEQPVWPWIIGGGLVLGLALGGLKR